MTAKQQAFVTQYLVDLNATQAAIRAGYSAATAGQQGERLLKNVEISQAVRMAIQARAKRVGVTADQVLAELSKVGFSDMRKFATWGASGVRLNDSVGLTDDEARCVAEVSETVTEKGGTLRFKLHDKVGALEKIARHLGMFVDRQEHIFPDMTPEDRQNRVAAILMAAKERKQTANGNGAA